MRIRTLPAPWGWGHGLVLRRRVLGEEDLRLDILFLRRGLLEGVVRRGALAPAPYTAALVPPAISFFQFQWVSPERVRIRQWEERRLFPRARSQAPLALELCHALSALLPRGWWDPGLFKVALRGLKALEEGGDGTEARLSLKLGILEATGHSPWHLLPPRHTREDLERVIDELWIQLLPPSGRWKP